MVIKIEILQKVQNIKFIINWIDTVMKTLAQSEISNIEEMKLIYKYIQYFKMKHRRYK